MKGKKRKRKSGKERKGKKRKGKEVMEKKGKERRQNKMKQIYFRHTHTRTVTRPVEHKAMPVFLAIFPCFVFVLLHLFVLS